MSAHLGLLAIHRGPVGHFVAELPEVIPVEFKATQGAPQRDKWASSSRFSFGDAILDLTARGNLWYPRTVRQMLEMKRSAGIRAYEGVDHPAVWPAIFDAETWERLQLTIRLKAQAANDRSDPET